MSLHDRIMGLPVFTVGSEMTRNEAAALAKEADELMAEMAKELEWYRSDADCMNVLMKYNAYKEQ